MLTAEDKETIRLIVRDEVCKLFDQALSDGVMPRIREEVRRCNNRDKLEVVLLVCLGVFVGTFPSLTLKIIHLFTQ